MPISEGDEMSKEARLRGQIQEILARNVASRSQGTSLCVGNATENQAALALEFMTQFLR